MCTETKVLSHIIFQFWYGTENVTDHNVTMAPRFSGISLGTDCEVYFYIEVLNKSISCVFPITLKMLKGITSRLGKLGNFFSLLFYCEEILLAYAICDALNEVVRNRFIQSQFTNS